MFRARSKFLFGAEPIDSDVYVRRGNLILFKEDSESFNHKIFLRVFASVNNIKEGLSTDEEQLEIPLCNRLETDLDHLNFFGEKAPYELNFAKIDYAIKFLPTEKYQFPKNNFIVSGLFSPFFNEKYGIKNRFDFYIYLYRLRKHVIERGIVCAVTIPTYLHESVNFFLYFDFVFSFSLFIDHTGLLIIERGVPLRKYLFKIKADGIECEYFREQPEDIAPTKKSLCEEF